MYSLHRKLYISQLTENQRDAGLNVGFVYSLYSFFVFPFIYVYSDKNEPRATLHFLCRPKSFADVMEHRHADFKPNYFSEKTKDSSRHSRNGSSMPEKGKWATGLFVRRSKTTISRGNSVPSERRTREKTTRRKCEGGKEDKDMT